MGFTATERQNFETKALMAGVADANATAVWYETFFPYAVIVDLSQVWAQLSTIRLYPAANLTAARAAAAGGLSGVLIDLSHAADAVRLTLVPGTNNSTYAAYETYGDLTSTRLNNWLLPQLVPQASGAPSNGYAISLYEGDPNAGGVLISTSAGTTGTGSSKTSGWIFNYANGLLFLSDDYKAAITDPYILGFRYVGDTAPGLSGVLASGNSTSGTNILVSPGDVVLLGEGPAPATASAQGAVFNSDGTGGLTAGFLHYREPSNGTVTDIVGTLNTLVLNNTRKRPCRLATTANVANFAGGAPNLVDGVTPVIGDRIFAGEQTSTATKGIYRVTTVGTGSNGTWVRDSDFDADADVTAGLTFYVQEGSVNAQTRFTLITTGAISLGATALSFIQEAPLVRTDASSTEIIAAGTVFTSGTIVWSAGSTTAENLRDHKGVAIWFCPATLGSVTSVTLYMQWSDDGSTIAFDDDNGLQQTDFLINTGSDGSFAPRDYQALLTVGNGELVAGKFKHFYFPQGGGKYRFGVKGNNASGTFGVRAMRLA